jgi:hypothetical protein
VSCEQVITLSDTMAPLILDCPSDTTVAPSAGCFANVFWDQPLVVDNCGELNLQVSHVSGDQFPIGETVVTYLASDACGNQAMCSFTIKVEGECCDLPPIINCPPDYSGCPGDTILPKKIGRARAIPGRSTCEPPAVFYQDDTISQGPCAGAILIERVWFAVDPYDPSLNAMCVQTIELKDDRAPFLFGCPQDITVDSDPKCIAVVTWVEPSARDNCSSVTIEQSHSPGDTFQIGTTDVVYIARDECGNADTCAFTITVNKNCCQSEPILMCPMDYRGCPGGGISPMTTGEAMVEPGDPDCQKPDLTFFDTFVEIRPCYLEISRRWVATDPVDTSLRVSCIQRIVLTDEEDPKVVDCARDTTVLTNDDCVAIVDWEIPVFSDNCGMFTLASSHEPGDTFQIGTTTVTYTATDACGNETTCSFEVTVVDNCCNKPPSIECPADFEACPKADTDPDVAGRPVVTKAHPSCGEPGVSFSDTTISSGPCPNEEVIQRTWIASDPNDPTLADTCIQMIVLKDDEAPIFWECPADTTVSPNDDCIAIVAWTPPVADDNCGLVSVTSTHEPGDTFQIGTTTVTYVAVDACGNDTMCTFDITVTDECCQLPPTIDCPADFSGCPGFDISPDFIGRPRVQKSSDFCDDPVVTFVDDTISTGPCAGGVIIERTWTAVIPNRPSLMASCVQMITLEDTQAPVLTNCPKDTVVSPNEDCQAIVSWTRPGISDNCGIGSVTSTHEPGDTFDLGTTTVTYTLTDACGQSTTCSFTITVLNDCCNKPPSIECPEDFVGCPGFSTEPGKTGEPTVTKGHPSCEDPIITYEDNIISSGPCHGAVVIERTWTATDPGDTSLNASCVQIITLEDTEAPVLSNCPMDVTLSPNVNCEAKVSWQDPDANDNCGKVTLTSNFTSGDLFPIGTTTVVITATDDCGNQTTCSFDITVLDDCCNKPPSIECPEDFVGCPGFSTEPGKTGEPTVTKGHPDCEDPIITYEDNIISSGPCHGAVVIERTWTATDPGDTSLNASCVQIITLEDTEAPVLSNCPMDVTLSPNVDCEAKVSWEDPDVNDNCGKVTLTSNFASGDLFPIGTTTVVITATDDCGNQTTCSFDITVLDDCCNKPPSIECPSAYTDCPGSSTDPGVTGMPVVTKGHPTCEDPIVTFEDVVISSGPCTGAIVIERIWTATDPGDTALTASCVQEIVLEDTEAPVWTGCPGEQQAMANMSCKAVVSWIPPVATDNCTGLTVTSSHEPGDSFDIGTTVVTYTATDACGQVALCQFDVVVDGDVLFIECPNDTVITSPAFSFGDYVYWSPPNVIQCDPTCPDSIPGFIYMGERNGHRYFCSLYRASWTDAQEDCDSLGGYLAVINDEDENDYIAGLLMNQPAYIGLNDFASEGNFEWVNGDPLTFTSWAAGEPDNKNNYQDAVELHPDGTWKDQFYYVHNEFVLEIPCYDVYQIEGPENGGFFTCGETQVTYVVEDFKGRSDTCSFTVDVDCSGYEPYCYAKGLNSDQYWLNSLKVGDFFKRTGNDRGYGDYSPTCIELVSGSTTDICIGFGYGGQVRNLFWRAWIDYNNDRDFDDPGEEVANGFGSVADCGDIHVPAGLNQRSFMRVAVSFGQWPEACGSVPDGEYEDYCVIIEDGTGWLQQSDGADRILPEEAEAERSKDVRIYPNPTQGELNVEWHGGTPIKVEVIDFMGRSVQTLQNDIIETRSTMDVSTWQPGRYMLVSYYSDGLQKQTSFIVIQ